MCQGEHAQCLKSPDLYFNRELSWLEFNDRVLREGLSDDVPLLGAGEVPGHRQLESGRVLPGAGGGVVAGPGRRRAPPRSLRHVASRPIDGHQPAGPPHGRRAGRGRPRGPAAIGRRRTRGRWSPASGRPSTASFLQVHFGKEILPVLTPLAVQEIDPPPRLPGLQWYVAAVAGAAAARRSGSSSRRSPPRLPRWIPLPSPRGTSLARLEDVVAANAAAIFPGEQVLATARLPHYPRRQRRRRSR